MDVVIGLGSNLGAREPTLAAAAAEMAALATVTAVSSLYETDPVGPPQPDYLNAAIRLDAVASPRELLALLRAIELRHGRERRERWGPRTLDLDILWIAELEVQDPDLTVPHPRLAQRRFALTPLVEVAPLATHPRTGEPLKAWLAALGPHRAPEIRRVAGVEWAGALALPGRVTRGAAV